MNNKLMPPQRKAPAEILQIPVNFTACIPSGGTISTAVITSKVRTTGVSSTATIVSGSSVIADPMVTQKIHQGTDGEQHVLEWTLTYSDGSKTEHEMLLIIDKGMV